MVSRPLHDVLSKSATAMLDYCGAASPASFGDTSAEFTAMLQRAGVTDLACRDKFFAAGPDAIRWLNGMVTNNIRDLANSHGVYAFFLNAQGRIQADMYCYRFGADLLIDTDASQSAALRAAFDKFIIMDEVELRVSPLTSIGLTGPQSLDILRRAFPGCPEPEPLHVSDFEWQGQKLQIVRTDFPLEQFEVWSEADAAPAIWNALVSAGAAPCGSDAVEKIRIWAGRPRYGVDIRERDLPQETGQDRALHFSKGCYVGQEIVERIRSRGAVHRNFAGFAFESGPPPVGSKIEADGKEVGEITSSATLPGDEGPPLVALGYIRREATKPGTALSANGNPCRVVTPPFVYVAENP